MAIGPQKPNNGFFGKNNNRKSERSPDYTGSVLVGDDTLSALMAAKASGKAPILYLKGWKKTSQAGNQYISLLCNPPNDEQVQRKPQAVPEKQAGGDADIPF